MTETPSLRSYSICTCVVGLLHLALALQDGVDVAPGKVDVGVVHPRALRHRPAPQLLQPLDLGLHVIDRRVGVVGAQLGVNLGHVGGDGGCYRSNTVKWVKTGITFFIFGAYTVATFAVILNHILFLMHLDKKAHLNDVNFQRKWFLKSNFHSIDCSSLHDVQGLEADIRSGERDAEHSTEQEGSDILSGPRG